VTQFSCVEEHRAHLMYTLRKAAPRTSSVESAGKQRYRKYIENTLLDIPMSERIFSFPTLLNVSLERGRNKYRTL